MDMMELGAKISFIYIPFLFALCFHEYAHGYIAKKRGDNTAQMMGRLSMNPVVHMDLFGTVLLPMMAIIFSSPIFFGWAKPVPVNPRNLKNPKNDMFWVALAGPLSNVLLALIATIIIGIVVRFVPLTTMVQSFIRLMATFILTNLFLAVFNMLPLNPLDGGKVLARFLSPALNYRLEKYEHISGMILMALIFLGALKFLSAPVHWMYDLLLQGVGVVGGA